MENEIQGQEQEKPAEPKIEPAAGDPTVASGGGIPEQARTWAMACHLMALSGVIVQGIGFVLGPLITWLIKKDDHPFIDEQGKEAVNFQITMLLAMIASALLIFVFIGVVLLPLIAIGDIVFTVIAALKAKEGEHYRYPFAFRFVK
ncbi:DUF4870 domain-containing protein [bacterium]|jgi:uncharacterized Tic20 family protein|nr:DUF4870 domain-containing protein [bacterium]